MACSTILQAALASRRVASAYAPPESLEPLEPLEPLHILDLLELTGSQPQAARALAMHQSTVRPMRVAMEAQPGSRRGPARHPALKGEVEMQWGKTAVAPIDRQCGT